MKALSEYLAPQDKKGYGDIISFGTLIGALITVVVIIGLAPSFFGNWNAGNLSSNAPSWLVTVGPIIMGAGLLMFLWRAFR